MKTFTTNKTIIAALLVGATLVVSGCHNTPAPAAQTQTKAQLKHSFGKENIKLALTNAAKENGWEVSNAGEKIVIMKKFTKKETDKNARGRTWNKVITTKEIQANVSVNDNSYEINLTPESKEFFTNYSANEELKRELHKLDNTISVELVHEIL